MFTFCRSIAVLLILAGTVSAQCGTVVTPDRADPCASVQIDAGESVLVRSGPCDPAPAVASAPCEPVAASPCGVSYSSGCDPAPRAASCDRNCLESVIERILARRVNEIQVEIEQKIEAQVRQQIQTRARQSLIQRMRARSAARRLGIPSTQIVVQ